MQGVEFVKPEPVVKKSTNETMEMVEKRPLQVYRDATARGMEPEQFLNETDKGDIDKGMPFTAKVLKKHKIRANKTKHGPSVMIGELLPDPNSTPTEEIAFKHLMFHIIMTKRVESYVNYGISLLEPVNVDPLTRKMTNLQKLDGAFTVSDQLRDTMLRPAIRRPDEFKEHPRLVVELSDLVMGQFDIPFGGEKTLRIDNDPSRFPEPRIAELEEIPRAQLGVEDISAQVYKFGIGLEASYEFVQAAANISVDHISVFFSQLATYWRLNEVNLGIKEALKVFTRAANAKKTTKIGPDMANDNPAPKNGYNSTDLGSKLKSGTGGTLANHLDLYSWRNMWKAHGDYSKQHIRLNHILAKAPYTTEIELLNLDKTNISLDNNVGPNESISSVNPLPALRTRDGHPYGWTDEIPDKRALIYDRNWFMQYFVRMVSNIAETERFILNQSQVWTLTKAFGFKVYDEDGAEYIDIRLRPAETAKT